MIDQSDRAGKGRAGRQAGRSALSFFPSSFPSVGGQCSLFRGQVRSLEKGRHDRKGGLAREEEAVRNLSNREGAGTRSNRATATKTKTK